METVLKDTEYIKVQVHLESGARIDVEMHDDGKTRTDWAEYIQNTIDSDEYLWLHGERKVHVFVASKVQHFDLERIMNWV